MTENELQAVLKAMRKEGINIVAIHQHMTGEEPRILVCEMHGGGSQFVKVLASKAKANHPHLGYLCFLMTYLVRRFITALSPEGQHRLFLHVALTAPDLGHLKRRERANRIVDAVNGADPKSRSLVQAIAGHVLALADKGDLAERALRVVCQGREGLHEILERDLFLEERCAQSCHGAPLARRTLSLWFHGGEVTAGGC
jgi:hypothetical protein